MRVEEKLRSILPKFVLPRCAAAKCTAFVHEVPECLVDVRPWPRGVKVPPGLVVYELPEELGQLALLEELDVSRNKLRTLPDALGELSQLKVLNASGNSITELSPPLLALPALTQLNLHDNSIKNLPIKALSGALPSLVSLNLSHNHLSGADMRAVRSVFHALPYLFLDANLEKRVISMFRSPSHKDSLDKYDEELRRRGVRIRAERAAKSSAKVSRLRELVLGKR